MGPAEVVNAQIRATLRGIWAVTDELRTLGAAAKADEIDAAVARTVLSLTPTK